MIGYKTLARGEMNLNQVCLDVKYQPIYFPIRRIEDSKHSLVNLIFIIHQA